MAQAHSVDAQLRQTRILPTKSWRPTTGSTSHSSLRGTWRRSPRRRRAPRPREVWPMRLLGDVGPFVARKVCARALGGRPTRIPPPPY